MLAPAAGPPVRDPDSRSQCARRAHQQDAAVTPSDAPALARNEGRVLLHAGGAAFTARRIQNDRDMLRRLSWLWGPLRGTREQASPHVPVQGQRLTRQSMRV